MRKQDISELVSFKSQQAGDDKTVKIGAIGELRRWTLTALGEEVDALAVSIYPLGGYGKTGKTIPIVARDYEGILAEVADAVKKAFGDAGDFLADSIKSGYSL